MVTRKSTATKNRKQKIVKTDELDELVNEGKNIDVEKAKKIIAENESIDTKVDNDKPCEEEINEKVKAMEKDVKECSDTVNEKENTESTQSVEEVENAELITVIEDVEEKKEKTTELNVTEEINTTVESEADIETVEEVTENVSEEENSIVLGKNACTDIAEEDKGTAEEEIMLEEQPIDDVITECLGEATPNNEEKKKDAEPWYIARAKRLGDYYNY